MRRWALAAVLAVLVTVGGGWGEPRPSSGPARGAGPASVDLALPAGVAPARADAAGRPARPRSARGAPPGPAGSRPGAAPAAPAPAPPPSPPPRSPVGGRSPPARVGRTDPRSASPRRSSRTAPSYERGRGCCTAFPAAFQTAPSLPRQRAGPPCRHPSEETHAVPVRARAGGRRRVRRVAGRDATPERCRRSACPRSACSPPTACSGVTYRRPRRRGGPARSPPPGPAPRPPGRSCFPATDGRPSGRASVATGGRQCGGRNGRRWPTDGRSGGMRTRLGRDQRLGPCAGRSGRAAARRRNPTAAGPRRRRGSRAGTVTWSASRPTSGGPPRNAV